MLSLEKNKGIFVVGKPHHSIGIAAGYQERNFFGEGYTQRVFEHVLKVIDKRGDCFSYQRKNTDQEYTDLFKNNNMINGLLIFAPGSEEKEKLLAFRKNSRVPFIVVGVTHPVAGISSADSDNLADSCAGVKELIEMGHRRIAFISNRRVSPTHTLRLNGYRQALQEADIPFDGGLVLMEDVHARNFARRLRKIFAKRVAAPTAVFGAGLEAAEAAAEILEDDRRKRLTVLAYDDTAWKLRPAFGRYGIISQPYSEIGVAAIEKLYQLMAGEMAAPVRILLKSQIIFAAQKGRG